MLNIGIKQECPLFPTLFGLYINELKTYLEEIDGNIGIYLTKMVVFLL